jgi:hypothetical protein
MVLGEPYPPILVVEPVYLKLAIRKLGIQVAPEHVPSVIRVFLHLSSEIEACDLGIGWI